MAKAKLDLEEINEEAEEFATNGQKPEDFAFDMEKFAKETLLGDTRDMILKIIKDMEKPWKNMSQMEQTRKIEDVRGYAQNLIGKISMLIASDGRKVIGGAVEKVEFKDGIKATIKCSSHDPLRHVLADADFVMMVVTTDYSGEKEPAKADPDQPDLPLFDSTPTGQSVSAEHEDWEFNN